jgi:hypothetical protein
MKLLAIAAGCAALALCTGALAQGYGAPADLARFDARTAPDVAAKLAICDTARFLRTSPNLDADLVYVRRDDGQLDLLLPPYFVGGPEWYDEDLERAYRRLRRQGEVTYDQVRMARQDIGREMVRAFKRGGGHERRYLDDQSRYCKTVEDAGRA